MEKLVNVGNCYAVHLLRKQAIPWIIDKYRHRLDKVSCVFPQNIKHLTVPYSSISSIIVYSFLMGKWGGEEVANEPGQTLYNPELLLVCHGGLPNRRLIGGIFVSKNY